MLNGWIKIEGTNVDYPVMQNEDYYLNRDFYKKNSESGVPYVAKYCKLEISDNTIIYGHHMKDGSMFADLCKYESFEFCKSHPIVEISTLENGKVVKNNYQICYCLKTQANEEGFMFYCYYDLSNEEMFENFKDNCEKLKLYDTGERISKGDKLITLCTCEYSQPDGRFLVIAKKI